jgi:glutathione peroxidase
MSIYDILITNAKGQEQSLADYKGRVLLIVNTASKCGFTPQYAELQELYAKWHDQGLDILAFPCDQFAHQEPGTNEEIQQFCQMNYGVTFPVNAKIDVNGINAHPLFTYLRSSKKSFLGDSIKWNFTKFLVDRKGEVTGRFEPVVKPGEMAKDIQKLLDEEADD